MTFNGAFWQSQCQSAAGGVLFVSGILSGMIGASIAGAFLVLGAMIGAARSQMI